MALCPFADWKLIPPGSSDPAIRPRVAILHVAETNASSLYEFFRDRSGGIESHFYIRYNGDIEQYRDTEYQADANYLANDFAVSIETQGYAAEPWTAGQLASIKRLLVWLHVTHPAIKMQKCPTWDGSGVGYHVQFGAPGKWTPVAKSCPGQHKIRQYDEIIVPWLEAGGEEDMQLNDDIYPGSQEKDVTVQNVLQRLDRYLAGAANRDKRIRELLHRVMDAVDANADKAEIKNLLEHLDVEFRLVVNDAGEPA